MVGIILRKSLSLFFDVKSSSLFMARMATSLVTRGEKHAYISKLVVTQPRTVSYLRCM